MMVPAAIAEFRRQHAGAPPRELLVSHRAAVYLSIKEALPPSYDGIVCRLVVDVPAPVEPGTGTHAVLGVTRLKGGVVGVVAFETRLDS